MWSEWYHSARMYSISIRETLLKHISVSAKEPTVSAERAETRNYLDSAAVTQMMTVPVKPSLCQTKQCLDFGISISDLADTQQSGTARFSFSSWGITSIFLSQSIARPTKGVRSRLPVTQSPSSKRKQYSDTSLVFTSFSLSVRTAGVRRSGVSDYEYLLRLVNAPSEETGMRLRLRSLPGNTWWFRSSAFLPLNWVTQRSRVGSSGCGRQKVQRSNVKRANTLFVESC